MTFPWRSPLLLLGFLSLFASASSQTVLPLQNPGFESPALSIGSSWSSNVPGWNQIGISGTTWRVPWAAPSPPPEGDQYLFANGVGSTITQVVGTLEANRRYVFTIDVFALDDDPDRSIEVAFDVFQEVPIPGGSPINAFLRTTYSVYNVEWYRWLKDFDLAPQTWTTVEVVLDARDHPHLLGQAMQVRVTGNRYAADNARLVSYAEGEFPPATNRTFHISSSDGNDAHDGRSPATPWRTFRNVNAMVLGPGDSVLLKRGDEWRDELNLRGSGRPGAPVQLASYGDPALDRPRIRRHDVEFDRCIVVQRPSHWEIRGMDVRHAKLGIFLRYHNSFNNRDVLIDDCRFEDMPEKTLQPEKHGYELAFSNGIWLGGHVWNNQMNDATVLDGLTITNCEAYRVAHLFSTAFYFPPPNRHRVRNILIADSRAVDVDNGLLSAIGVANLRMERTISLQGGVDNWAGSAQGMVQNAENVVIDNNEFGYIDRRKSADGVGFDFEGDCINCSFTNNILHDAAGAGLLILTTMGANTNLVIEDNVFYNNAWNPWNNEIHVEVSSGANQNTGRISNNGFHRRDPRVGYFSPLSAGFQRTNNRLTEFDASLLNAWWDMADTADATGWSALQSTVIEEAAEGILVRGEGGTPPGIQSPSTWINSHLQPYLWIRTRQATGDLLTVSFVTEPHPLWDTTRRMVHPVASDGMMRDYWIDMRHAPNWRSIITQVRLEWPDSDEVEIEHVRFTGFLDPQQIRPDINTRRPLTMTLHSEPLYDGSILESAQNSGQGGVVASAGTSFSFGDDAGNRRYRGFFSFDTSVIPDNAVITAAQVGFTRVSIVGMDPWTFGGSLVDGDYGTLDMAVPHFGSSATLDPQDWQSDATVPNAGRYIVPYKNGLTVMDLLTPEARSLINTTGRTQFRLRMEERGTNFNNAADHISIASGSASPSQRPFLHLEYNLDEAPAATPLPSPPDYWLRPLTLPRPPKDLVVTSRSHDAITWSWEDDSEQEDEFRLYLAEGTIPPASFTSTVPANTTLATTTGLTPNTFHALRVTAANSIGESGGTGTVLGLTLAETPLAPELIDATESTIRFRVPTGRNPADTKVAIWIQTPSGNGWLQSDGLLSASEQWLSTPDPLILESLSPESVVAIRAKARNRANEESDLGPSLNVTTAPAPPFSSGWMIH